ELERTKAGLRQNLPDLAVEDLARRQHDLRAGKDYDPPGGDRVRSFGQSRRRSDKQGHQACRNGTHSSIRLNGANLSPPPGRGFGTTWTISDGSYAIRVAWRACLRPSERRLPTSPAAAPATGRTSATGVLRNDVQKMARTGCGLRVSQCAANRYVA